MIDKPEDKTKRELVEIVKIQQEEYLILLEEYKKLLEDYRGLYRGSYK